MMEHNEVTPLRMREILGHFCSGLTIVTGMGPEGPIGFTCQSFSSVSLDPALISINPSRSSTTWPVLRDSRVFCVNILPAEHLELSSKFARSGTDKFSGVSYSVSELGNPILDKALAWIDCELFTEHDGGDHTIALGAVKAMHAESDADPLLFFKGTYATVALS